MIAGPLILVAIIWLPPWVFLTMVALSIAGAASELVTMARSSGVEIAAVPGPVVAAAIAAAAWVGGCAGLIAALAASLLVISAARLGSPHGPQGGLVSIATTCLISHYLGVTGACIGWILIRPQGDLGRALMLLFLVSIWVGDSGAYYVGKSLGRHRMSPRISPKKTWEGLVGGVLATYAAVAAFNLVFPLAIGWLHLAALATILAVLAPVGDLVESLLKRDTGVKDSSALIPGHGGLLDRTDSLLYCAPPFLGYLALAGIAP
jgi:phosphatidate cytidylyltransferase